MRDTSTGLEGKMRREDTVLIAIFLLAVACLATGSLHLYYGLGFVGLSLNNMVSIPTEWAWPLLSLAFCSQVLNCLTVQFISFSSTWESYSLC